MTLTEVRFIGDVHGRYNPYEKIIQSCSHSIQVGDMGVGFFSVKQGEIKKSKNPSFDKMSKGWHKFIRGNHDNPQHCLNHPHCLEDGGVYELGDSRVYTLGGAVSIDRAYRTEGLDWWPDEELPQNRLDIEVELYKEIKPDVVVTHDCPESIARQVMDILNIYDKDKFPSRTRLALDQMLFHHQPRHWIFGHWHKDMEFNQAGTNFICLAELSYIDLEL